MPAARCENFRGLLATLLSQVLQTSPLALDSMFKQDLDICHKVTISDWSTSELETWLIRGLKHDETRFCIFVDSLDEAELESGLPENAIVQFVKRAATLPNVKCCVSNRPLQRFELAFGSSPHLQLQELNESDIQRYYDDYMTPAFNDADIEMDPVLLKLLKEMFCYKAAGVFLWACLAVNSLKSGIENHDSIAELLHRLEAMPSELEGFYEQMWKRQNRDFWVYQDQASLFLNVCIGFHETSLPKLLELVLLQSRNYHLSDDILAGKITEELEHEYETIQLRVLTRCAGLLIPYREFHDKDLNKHCSILPHSFPAPRSAL